jgi:pimeloyl-ACP methyl ester carboxylesterase
MLSPRLFAASLVLAAPLALPRPADAAPIDQASWIARKQSVRLPNGVTLAYAELGNPKGEPLLLLHGFTDTSRVWTALTPQLLRYRLLIPDQRGHGQSDKPDCCYALSDLAQDARLLLDALRVERAHVAGHSLGSMVAQALAAEHPGRVGKLVLIGSTGRAPLTRDMWMWRNIMAMTDPVPANTAFLKAWSPTQSPTPVDAELARWNDKEIAEVPLHVWRAVPRELLDLPIARYGPDIQAPTLILSAAKDALFDHSHHDALAKAIPHARAVVLPDLGHNLILERPHVVGPAILDFLDTR